MDYIIAIPSHKRKNILEQRTLAFLNKHNINFSNVYVFVSSDSYEDYLELQEKYKFNLIQHVNDKFNDSILEIRNNIIEYFEENQKIIEIDDDIKDLEKLDKNKKNESVENLNDLFNNCFAQLNGSGLFGFCSKNNSFFASCCTKYGLYSIVNSCLGYINDKRIFLTVREKEDFERVLQFHTLGLQIIKFGQYGINTTYWKNKGGIQARYNFEARKIIQRNAALELVLKYPDLCYITNRSNGLTDIKFKYFKKNKIKI